MSDCCARPEQECRTSPEQYLEQLSINLPRGIIWDQKPEKIQTKFWSAIAKVFSDANNFICDSVDEMFPCTSDELLDRWEPIFGLPVECLTDDSLTVAERQDRLCSWIMSITDPDCRPGTIGFLQNVLDIFGFEDVLVSEYRPTGFQAGCGQAGCNGAASSVCFMAVVIEIPSSHPDLVETQIQAGACCGQAGKPICQIGIPVLDCLLDLLVPNHVPIIYTFACRFTKIDESQCFFEFVCP